MNDSHTKKTVNANTRQAKRKPAIEKRIEHVCGIIEEHHDDGSISFTGDGGGVLWFLAHNRPFVEPPQPMPPHPMPRQRIRLLMEVAAKHMPERKIELSDVENFKGEALVLLEELKAGSASFFRELADAIQPRKTATKKAGAHAKSKREKDDTVLLCIIKAVEESSKPPIFNSILSMYRETNHNAAETPSAFKKKLKARGFSWLCGNFHLCK